MIIRQALDQAGKILAAEGIQDHNLESEILLRHTLKMDRARLFLEMEAGLSSGQQREFLRLVERRVSGEPTAYLTGHREFYGLDFLTNRDVLIPRPESELLVEQAIETAKIYPFLTIADIGTGSGAIAVSLAVNLPRAMIYATDISASALEVARTNCRKHRVTEKVHLLEGDLLEPLPEPVDIIIANLPYVPSPELDTVNTRGFEPSLALDGGPDGLKDISRLCAGVDKKLKPGGCLLLEIGQGQGEAVTGLLVRLFPSAALEITADLGGIERVIKLSLARRTGTRILDAKAV
ncbi:MAG: peptide chain release factor N(5)-glutamine methyltransferase [Dehalococcoidales bacterium]